MNYKWHRISWLVLRHYSVICLDRLRNSTRNTEQFSAVATLLDLYSGGAWFWMFRTGHRLYCMNIFFRLPRKVRKSYIYLAATASIQILSSSPVILPVVKWNHDNLQYGELNSETIMRPGTSRLREDTLISDPDILHLRITPLMKSMV